MEPSKYSNRVTICTYNIMFFNDIAHSNAVDLVGYIKKSPLYKQQVKQIVNCITKEIKSYTTLVKKLGRTQFFSYACDNMADNLGADIFKLENSIKFALDKAKLDNTEFLAKLETARVLVWGGLHQSRHARKGYKTRTPRLIVRHAAYRSRKEHRKAIQYVLLQQTMHR